MERSGGDAKKRQLVEATVSQKGGGTFVTRIAEFQPPKSGTFGKVVDADVDGNKGQAVELEHEGQKLTLAIPGKLSGTRWVTDADLLADAKRLKAGAPVVFKTREDGDKSYVRQIGPAPKESAKKDSAKPPSGPMLGSKEPAKK
jgi:hypothetical protein